jgi:hypothetical protein
VCKLISIMARLKMILCLLFLFGLKIKVNSQNFGAQVIGGLNIAQVDGDSYGGYNQPGILGGFSIYRTSLNKNKSLNTEKRNFGFSVLFSQKGSHKKNTEESTDIFKLRFTYLCFPIFMDIKNIKNIEKLTLRLALSPNLNVVSKQNFGYGWNDTKIKPYEISASIGIHYAFSKQFFGLIQAENSILSVGDPVITSIYYNQNSSGLYNRLVSFALGYNLKQ